MLAGFAAVVGFVELAEFGFAAFAELAASAEFLIPFVVVYDTV